jgi:hypothetical protein
MLAFLLVLLVSLAGAVPALATETVTGTGSVSASVPINGTISPLTISVTHPASITWTINPNNTQSFAAPDIVVTNNTKCAIRVTVSTLKAATAKTQGDTERLMTDVLYTAKNWPTLSAADSASFIAVGIRRKDNTNWNGTAPGTHWALDGEDTLFGTVGSDLSAAMTLEAYHGYAIEQQFIAVHNLVLVFDLA